MNKHAIIITILLFFHLVLVFGQVSMPYPPIDTDSTIYEDGISVEELEEILRTSDIEGEKSTHGNYQQRYKPIGKRIGCICMDGSKQEKKGRGACSGFGGVRFWIYQDNNNETLFPTERHIEHPEPLSEEELEQLAGRMEKEVKHGTRTPFYEKNLFYVMIISLIICITVMYVTKVLFLTK
ncbi:hypothetical protein [Flammeovirga sp. SJP92]|uniref:hypothetical protein n=1 Tax=Flammeovirga sp. SJP92 TaxID=1775430 RepID=UPI00078952C6|nr:hypothetical protein [Flammeovirga sp. SJP92]KXX69430.1 hypothetical protein AVL50_19325 [Flammeovirga sp. SJP92]